MSSDKDVMRDIHQRSRVRRRAGGSLKTAEGGGRNSSARLVILMISMDRSVFRPESEARRRMIDYGEIFDQLHVVVFSLRRHGFHSEQIAPNVWVYPTDSWMRIDYVLDVFSVIRRQLTVQGKLIADVISAQDVEAGLVGWLIARRYHRALQFQLHGDPFSPYFKEARRFNRLRLSAARFLLARARCVRVASERVQGEIEKRYPHLRAKVSVLPVRVDVEYFRKTPPSFDLRKRYPQFSFIILMASRLAEEKDIHFALEVFAEVLRHYAWAGLVIVGEGSLKGRVVRHASALGISDKVTFEGRQEDIISYYKTANLLLHTSRYEGYGMALIEAAACGLPIVTSDVGIASSLKSKKQDTFVCPVGDKECFVREILLFLSDNARRLFFKFNVRDELEGLTTGSREAYLNAYRDGVVQCLQSSE